MAQTYNVGYKTLFSDTITVDDVGVVVDFSAIPDQQDALMWISNPTGGQVVGMGPTGVAFADAFGLPIGQVFGPLPVMKLTDMVLIVSAGTQDVSILIAIPG